jgi:PEP-CTERM motif
MKNLVCLLIAAILHFALIVPAFALDIGSNITIDDENGYDGSGVGFEDGETEPGMVNNQYWDLEGFFYDQSNTLSMVGGYDFMNGYGGYAAGDIFISTGTPLYGSSDLSGVQGNVVVSNSYGYDFVLDLVSTADGKLTGEYSVYRIDDTATVLTANYLQNEGSSPWQYDGGGTYLESGTFSSQAGLSDADTKFLGGSHYLLTDFDLSFLDPNAEFYTHFTMGCGNDNLMGQAETAPVPEPSTFMLMGVGGGLLWLVRRRKDLK